MRNVLMLASEMTPFCKTGGLADVIGALPRALASQNIDARVLLPHYSGLDYAGRSRVSLGEITVPFDGALVRAEVQQLVAPAAVLGSRPDTTVYLLDCPRFFHRAKLYGESDDILRFGFFCRAAVEALRAPHLLNWKPDFVHCHDWHAGLFAAYLRALKMTQLRTVFSIHNLAYQGLAPAAFLARLQLPLELFTPSGLEFYGQVNPLKAGLVFCDALTTVSRTYAGEITTPERGEGLDGVLRARQADLHGIVNGVDYDVWNPATDTYLAANYSASSPRGKRTCKAALLERCGLSASRIDRPLIGLVSRLSSQKGLDLVAETLPDMVAMGATFVLLGSGDARYQGLFESLGKQYGDAASFNIGTFNENLAHNIYAGSDFFLMPSLYEPCGLSQLIALAYGTIPIVRATGGLRDTVEAWDGIQGTGFLFDEFQADALLDTTQQALLAYTSREWPGLVQNAFAARWPWESSAQRYAEIYDSLSGKYAAPNAASKLLNDVE
ncbi:MAG TPA: glycogen synthase GlgA [Abditibacteriaceae bacterium]|jgi:starch synthase